MINNDDRLLLKAKVLKLKELGYSVAEISNELSLARSTVWDWVNDRRRNTTESSSSDYPVAYVNTNKNFQRPVNKEEVPDLQAYLENLAPISLPKPDVNPAYSEHSDYVVVLSDLHFPMHCQKSIDIAFTVIDELKPKSIILNGDTVDMLAISRYSKDIRKSFNLLEERVAYQKFLHTLVEVSNGASIIETNGNHSGDSIAGRWWRYLSERIPELACLPEIKKTLSYENVFIQDLQQYVQLADYVELNPDLVVLHGEIVRKHGGYSAQGHLEKYYQSIIHGHTHRVGHSSLRIPAIGSRGNKTLHAWEIGCMCDLNPLYGSAVNWQNAFGIVSLGRDDTYGVELVNINNGKANVASLGKTVIA